MKIILTIRSDATRTLVFVVKDGDQNRVAVAPDGHLPVIWPEKTADGIIVLDHPHPFGPVSLDMIYDAFQFIEKVEEKCK